MSANKAKSIFIGVMPMVLMGLAVWSGLALVRGGWHWGHAGVLLTTVPFMGLLGRLMIGRNVARTASGLPLLVGAAVVGVGLSVFAAITGDPSTVGPAVTGTALVAAYTFWYSRLGRSPAERLAVGQTLPDFELRDADGVPVPSSQLRGGPSIVMFFRGNWCPLCMAQIKEIAGLYRTLADRGVEVVLVSPQSAGKTASLSKRFDAPMRFLVDPDNHAARMLGIAAPDGLPMGMQVLGYDSETVLPTVIITDATGTIVFCHETDNYRIRPEPETFIAVLDQHGIGKPTAGAQAQV